MTDTLIEEIKRNRAAGTPGPWTWGTESGDWPDHSLVGGDGDPILAWDMDLGFRFEKAEDARRIAAVPDMESRILADAEVIKSAEELAQDVLEVQAYRAQCLQGSVNLSALSLKMKAVEVSLAAFRKAQEKAKC